MPGIRFVAIGSGPSPSPQREDRDLIKIVHSEVRNNLIVSAHLTRFGDLAAFVFTVGFVDCLWQGDNVVDARKFAEGYHQ